MYSRSIKGSLIATTVASGLAYTARNTMRPMRPNPLIPTLIGILGLRVRGRRSKSCARRDEGMVWRVSGCACVGKQFWRIENPPNQFSAPSLFFASKIVITLRTGSILDSVTEYATECRISLCSLRFLRFTYTRTAVNIQNLPGDTAA